MDSTNEFSFYLKPSAHGIGIFAAHPIKTGTYLRLFGEEKEGQAKRSEMNDRVRNKSDVPELFQQYCIDRGDTLICPIDFGCMPIGWYLNHSNTPNAAHKNYHYYTIKDISSGDEIVIDYNSLEEPDEAKPDYYVSKS